MHRKRQCLHDLKLINWLLVMLFILCNTFTVWRAEIHTYVHINNLELLFYKSALYSTETDTNFAYLQRKCGSPLVRRHQTDLPQYGLRYWPNWCEISMYTCPEARITLQRLLQKLYWWCSFSVFAQSLLTETIPFAKISDWLRDASQVFNLDFDSWQLSSCWSCICLIPCFIKSPFTV